MSNLYTAFLLGKKLAVANELPGINSEHSLTEALEELSTMARGGAGEALTSSENITSDTRENSPKATWGSKLDLDPDQAKEV